MLKTLLWVLGGVGSGIIVHLIVILSLPSLAETSVYDRISQLESFENIVLLDDLHTGSANPMRLDPELIFGVCQLDLTEGVGIVSARLPDDFWSISIFDAQGRAVFGTTNRSSVGQMIQLGVFNPTQIKQLASQQLDLAEGLLIVESGTDDLFVIVRLAPPHQAMRERYRRAMEQIICTHS